MANKTKVMVAAAAALTLGVTAACGGSSKSDDKKGSSAEGAGFNAAVTGVVNPSDKAGGTLNMWTSQAPDSFDPAISYYGWTINMARFFNRTLLAYDAKPGKDGLKLVPDLASAEPEITEGGKVYTFKLRSGLKFDDGTPITSKDVKYGIERIFAQDVVPGGPLYLQQLLDQGQKYPGPYKDTDPNKLGLKTVQTPDDSTIVFHLAKADSSFPYMLALPGGGPVPQKRDTGAKYALNPASSGPYMFAPGAIQPGKSATLTRNPNWDKSTDPIRKALPDKVVLTITTNAADMDDRLIAGTADIDAGQSGVQTKARADILRDPKLKANADAPNTGFIRYAAMSTNVAPFDNVACRKAVMYAADPTTLQAARGGPVAGGDIGTNMLPPNILGSDVKYDPYNRAQGKAQVEEAKKALTECGKPSGFATKIAVRNNKPAEIATATALQAALKAVNIDASIEQYDGSLISSVIGAPNNVHKKGYGIMIAGWGADYPNGSGYLQPLVDSRFLVPNGNYNLPEVKDPSIDGLFDQAAAETDPTKAADLYSQINHKIMDGAFYLPFVFDKALNYRNPRLTNVYEHSALAMVDFQALGVSDGK
ncbi:peptide ABC transporter substrate-binding protein [Actinoplanes sp. SE50]|uniref:ABC transporter substrate-binding protein n=1 Tax=unclassified Actinoplanes TaxID=2626549 RepID=UPI00023EE08D|nr:MULTISPECIES: ABC transporter substrate-binding protein [unclassified Actinoplanes]AEV89008.1 Periplasmic oligopeptide-binding protein [Actinoplanes sp. SE50/110]ATO87414.1 peptide ABC transporter substrate-binding protein [Actinoplanes sp. SE50]SLM04832.1 ABC-type peptide/nickel transporter, substrate-binding lipoprotein [Actinoplanes sp. SE50/110]